MSSRKSAASVNAEKQQQQQQQHASKPQQRDTASSKNVTRPEPHQSSSFFLVFTTIVALVAVFAVCNLPKDFVEDGILSGAARHANKKFTSFDQFYPFYLTEHSDVTNRLFHFVGTTLVIFTVALAPYLFHSLLIAGCVGIVANTLFADMPNGVYEAVLVLSVFLIFAAGNGVFKKALLVLGLGYGLAWIGHFHFQHNTPATFIYPTFSLASDFRMWFEMMTGKVPGLDQFPQTLAVVSQVFVSFIQDLVQNAPKYAQAAVVLVQQLVDKAVVAVQKLIG